MHKANYGILELFKSLRLRKERSEMSIMPEGGWQDEPQQLPDSNERVQDFHSSRFGYSRRSSYVTCKICDRGTLSSKTVFRMSGPAVVIGFILLIPSILGMLSCAVMLLVLNTSIGAAGGINAYNSRHLYQSSEDAKFRKGCKEDFIALSPRLPGISTPQFCECALSRYKMTRSLEGAGHTCFNRGLDGTLEQPSYDVEALYSGNVSKATNAGVIAAISVLGNAFLIGLGVSFFVGGLLGWLLVMKKRVLQCQMCGAVVNAS